MHPVLGYLLIAAMIIAVVGGLLIARHRSWGLTTALSWSALSRDQRKQCGLLAYLHRSTAAS